VNWKWLFGISVAVNVALLVAWQLRSPEPAESASAPSAAGPSPALSRPSDGLRSSASWDAPERGVRRKDPKAAPAPASVETEDYPSFIKKLRAAGLSEDTIATLVVAEFFDRGMDDRIALQRKFNHGELTQEEFQVQSRQVQKDAEAALTALLGKEKYRQYQIDHDYQLRQLRASGQFSPEAMGQYFDLRKAHQDQMAALQEQYLAQGIDPSEYQDQVWELQKAHQENLTKALGADVAARIRAETDWQVQNLRRQMAAVKVGDDEYVQIAQILQHYQQEQQRISALQRRGELASQDTSAQQQSIEQQRKDQLAAVLGPVRYAEYEKQNDHVFRQMKQFGRPNGLNDEQVDYVYAVVKNQRTQQQDLHKQLQAKQISREDYNALIEQLNSGTRNTLQRFLGADRYERRKRSVGQLP
jgi:hypothetical protein